MVLNQQHDHKKHFGYNLRTENGVTSNLRLFFVFRECSRVFFSFYLNYVGPREVYTQNPLFS